MKKQAGFTLIELIMVIVILGILAATALPKFVNLSGDAQTAATQGVAGALSSAGSINYGVYSIRPASATSVTNGLSCATVVTGIMQGGALPTGYTTGTSTAPNCTVDTTPTATGTVNAYVPLTN